MGFRPFIFNLAEEMGVHGSVRNTSAGVFIEAQGDDNILDGFYDSIKTRLPPLARIEEIWREEISLPLLPDFKILESTSRAGEFSLIPPDIATCPDCLEELFDPADRRYRYPFINCTNCGPRFSIINRMPYDRPFTSMATFELCDDCRAEYENPRDRRFHAQPIACPVCGPQLAYYSRNKLIAISDEGFNLGRMLIFQGGILALKGIGGYQLICDAFNTEAVARLRKGKLRSAKPFALMAYSPEDVSQYCWVSQADRDLLQSFQSPIVIMPTINDTLAHIAPGQHTLGFMLPYSPIHHMLLQTEGLAGKVFVVTSGNVSDEPMVVEDMDAFSRLEPMADGFLTHNRPVINRVDDSVMRSSLSAHHPMRRARGYTPDPVVISSELPKIFAAGALLKNTFAINQSNRVFISQHMGDLDNLETAEEYSRSVNRYFDLFQFSPRVIACDLHPNYISTLVAQRMAEERSLDLVKVQHHHAHLAACIAENRLLLAEDVIGLTYDGTGYGEDGAIWGGEVLTGSAAGFSRRFHLQYMPLPGGDAAIRKPYRIALAYLHALGIPLDKSLAPVRYATVEETRILLKQIGQNLNIHQTSSMGRLFDAVSALMGIRMEVSFEGQAAIEMEAVLDPDETGSYPYHLGVTELQVQPLISAVLHDLRNDVPVPVISARFHNTIAQASAGMIRHIIEITPARNVVLSGGVWQNMALLEKTTTLISELGLQVFTHKKMPANDGCISLGQLVVAGIKFKE